jgi:hypothetical protein
METDNKLPIYYRQYQRKTYKSRVNSSHHKHRSIRSKILRFIKKNYIKIIGVLLIGILFYSAVIYFLPRLVN